MTVRVNDETANAAVGAKVAFNRPDGSLISVKEVASDGMVTESVIAGGSVTVAQSFPQDGGGYEYTLKTIVGVRPGDTIQIGPVTPAPDWASIGSATVNFSSYTGAGLYEVGTRCNRSSATPGGGGISTVFGFQNDDCSGTKTTLDLLAIAYDDVNRTTPLAWSLVDALQSGTTGTNGAWNTSFNRFEVVLNNSPIGGSVGDTNVLFFRDNVPFNIGNDDNVNIVQGGSASFERLVPPGFPSAAHVAFQMFALDQSQILSFREAVAPGGSSLVLDLNELPVPMVTASSLDMTAARPEFSWTFDGPVHPGMTDGLLAFGFWVDSATEESWQWVVVTAPNTTSPLQGPMLPDDLVADGTSAARWPPPTSATVVGQATGVIVHGAFDGWDDLRKNDPFALFDDADELPPGAETGTQTLLSAGGLLPN
jgi:hypothetical protein